MVKYDGRNLIFNNVSKQAPVFWTLPLLKYFNCILREIEGFLLLRWEVSLFIPILEASPLVFIEPMAGSWWLLRHSALNNWARNTFWRVGKRGEMQNLLLHWEKANIAEQHNEIRKPSREWELICYSRYLHCSAWGFLWASPWLQKLCDHMGIAELTLNQRVDAAHCGAMCRAQLLKAVSLLSKWFQCK